MLLFPHAHTSYSLQTAETVEAIVAQLMEKQRAARQAALVKQLECGCPDSTCADGKSCSHPMRRLSSTKATANDKQRHVESNNNHVSSTTPNVLIGTRVSIFQLRLFCAQNCWTLIIHVNISFIHSALFALG